MPPMYRVRYLNREDPKGSYYDIELGLVWSKYKVT